MSFTDDIIDSHERKHGNIEANGLQNTDFSTIDCSIRQLRNGCDGSVHPACNHCHEVDNPCL